MSEEQMANERLGKRLAELSEWARRQRAEDREHPSNVLHRGEARDFLHAMDLLVRLCRREKEFVSGDDKLDREAAHGLDKMTNAALLAQTEYLRRVRLMELSLAGYWQRSDNADLRMIGECLRKGDYSGIAI